LVYLTAVKVHGKPSKGLLRLNKLMASFSTEN